MTLRVNDLRSDIDLGNSCDVSIFNMTLDHIRAGQVTNFRGGKGQKKCKSCCSFLGRSPLLNLMMKDTGEVGCGDGNVFSVIVFNLDSGETLEGQWSRWGASWCTLVHQLFHSAVIVMKTMDRGDIWHHRCDMRSQTIWRRNFSRSMKNNIFYWLLVG